MSVQHPEFPSALKSNVLSNYIHHELVTLVGSKVRLGVPRAFPFFNETLVVYDSVTNKELPKSDYSVLCNANRATLLSGRECGRVIHIKNPRVSSSVYVDYYTPGSMYRDLSEFWSELMVSLQGEGQRVSLSNIVGRPDAVPPAQHLQDVGDISGALPMTTILDQIAVARRLMDARRVAKIVAEVDSRANEQNRTLVGLAKALEDHKADYDNPHHDTADMAGLGKVVNGIIATNDVAITGTSMDQYIVPSALHAALRANILDELDKHIANKNNPHGTTAAQLGLGKVANVPTGTTQDVLAANPSNRLYLTPKAVSGALEKLGGDAISAHISRRDDPHTLTPLQIGLDKVANYTMASGTETINGAKDRYANPHGIHVAVASLVGDALNQHIADKDNPHDTTAALVGLGKTRNYGIATSDQLVNGTTDALYATPSILMDAINSVAADKINKHIADRSNPHKTNKTHIQLPKVYNWPTASVQQVIDGKSGSEVVTPAVGWAGVLGVLAAARTTGIKPFSPGLSGRATGPALLCLAQQTGGNRRINIYVNGRRIYRGNSEFHHVFGVPAGGSWHVTKDHWDIGVAMFGLFVGGNGELPVPTFARQLYVPPEANVLNQATYDAMIASTRYTQSNLGMVDATAMLDSPISGAAEQDSVFLIDIGDVVTYENKVTTQSFSGGWYTYSGRIDKHSGGWFHGTSYNLKMWISNWNYVLHTKTTTTRHTAGLHIVVDGETIYNAAVIADGKYAFAVPKGKTWSVEQIEAETQGLGSTSSSRRITVNGPNTVHGRASHSRPSYDPHGLLDGQFIQLTNAKRDEVNSRPPVVSGDTASVVVQEVNKEETW